MAKTIKARAKLSGDSVTVKALFTHIMETGLRKDKKTGEVIPAHYIQEVACTHNGNTVFTALWGPAVSKNPYLSFKFKGAAKGDKVGISWSDNKGGSDAVETAVK